MANETGIGKTEQSMEGSFRDKALELIRKTSDLAEKERKSGEALKYAHSLLRFAGMMDLALYLGLLTELEVNEMKQELLERVRVDGN